MKKVILLFLAITLFFALASTGSYATQSAQQQSPINNSSQQKVINYLVKEVRHQLITLPYYNLFDWLEGEVTADGIVTLRGYVVRASTKSDAEDRIKEIEGVEKVVNEIEVLPPSPADDHIRRQIYFALFNENSQLLPYMIQSVPPIHIIVKTGRVILKGVVATTMDSQLTEMKARNVPGTFEVKNELLVEKSSKK